MKKLNESYSDPINGVGKRYFLFVFVSVAMLVYGFFIPNVYASSENITQLNITTSPQTINAGEFSGVFNIQTQNIIGVSEQTSEKTYLILGSDSETGEFYDANATSCTTLLEKPSELVLSSVKANKHFCYKDTTPGSHILNISAKDQLWSSANQEIIINDLEGITPPDATDIFTEVTEDINIDTVWKKNKSPYVVKNKISIASGVTLSIESGVVVKFDTKGELLISGTLKSEGTAEDKVYFTSYKDDSLSGDTNNDGSDSFPDFSDWKGITFHASNSGNILNFTVSKYSYYGFSFGFSSADMEGFNVDQYISIKNSVLLFNNSDLSNLYLEDNSIVKINNSNIIGSDSETISLFGVSYLEIKNSFIRSINKVINIKGGSSVLLENINIDSKGDQDIYNSGISLADKDSFLNIRNSYIKNASDGVSVGYNTRAIISDSKFECSGVCINGYPKPPLAVLGGGGDIVSGCTENCELNRSGSVSIKNSKITSIASSHVESPEEGYEQIGISSYGGGDKDYLFEVNNCEIFGNNIGIYSKNAKITGSNNLIYNNNIGAKSVESESLVDLRNNFWGDKTGPKNLATNESGLGNEVSDNILFVPFLVNDPLKVVFSNVLFIPGLEASRLYVEKNILGIKNEDQLWEPNNNADVKDLFMDASGNSLNPNIYTRDVISETNVLLHGSLGGNIYKTFMNSMDGLVSSGEINNWKAVPYDWRLSADDIVNSGVEGIDGHISYTEEVPDSKLPYILDQLQKLVDTSKNGKVTIVTHSNGGIVSKALIDKLAKMKESGEGNLIDSIDKVVMVASPSVGTPKAIAVLLHGTDQGLLGGLVLKDSIARELASNSLGVYGLLPSEKYFDKVADPVVVFDSSVDKVNSFRIAYGDTIDTYANLRGFLLNSGITRSNPEVGDTSSANILSQALLDKEQNLHSNIDNLVYPDNIRTYQIVGFGLPTIKNVEYYSKHRCVFNLISGCKNINVLTEKFNITSDGDGTVVSPSASRGDGTDYYLDISRYNENLPLFSFNRSHSDIFEIDSIFSTIKNIIEDSSDLPEYVSNTKPETLDNLIFRMKSPVSLDIYDEEGRHTGIVPNAGSDFIDIEEQIPNSLYMQIGDEKMIVVPKDASYTIKMEGLDNGIFTLEEETLIKDIPSGSVSFVDIPTNPNMKAKVSVDRYSGLGDLSIDKEGDGTFETIVKLDDSSSNEVDISNNTNKVGYGSSPLKIAFNAVNNISVEKINYDKKDDLVNSKGNIQDKDQEDLNIRIQKLRAQNTIKETKNLEKKDINIGASAGSIESVSPTSFKLLLIIVGVIAVLLLALKFIFRVL